MAVTDDLAALAAALADVGRAVRDVVLALAPTDAHAAVVRAEGGDEVFGIDAEADRVVLERMAGWPGRLVMEGFDAPIVLGDGPWTFLVDPFDGTRPWLAGKRSAWVLLGAGRDATTLEDLEVGAAVELPTRRARWALSAWATAGGPVTAFDDDVAVTGGPSRPVTLAPRAGADLARSFVTVARFDPGSKAAIGAWEDTLLDGIETYEDPYLCSGGQLMGLATGQDAAVLDPRPLLGARFCAHPYDLAALVVARAAGVVVESLPPGPLAVPLDPHADVAWAGYANEDVAAVLRGRLPAG